MLIPKHNPLKVQVPKDHNYRIDEGKYQAVIHKINRTSRQTASGCKDNLRFMFELTVPGKERLLNLAKFEVPLNLENGSDLRNLLNRLLGKEKMAAMSGEEFDFETLAGLEVDVEIEHIITNKRDNYDYPFVQVRDVQLRGKLVKEQPSQPEPAKEGATTTVTE